MDLYLPATNLKVAVGLQSNSQLRGSLLFVFEGSVLQLYPSLKRRMS